MRIATLRLAQREAFVQRRDAESDAGCACGRKAAKSALSPNGDAVFGEHLADRLAPARRVGDDQDAAVVVLGETRAGAPSGSSARRSTASGGSGSNGVSAVARRRVAERDARRGPCARAKNASAFRNSSPGGRIGRAGSRARKRWRSLVSFQKRCDRCLDRPVQRDQRLCGR